MKPPRTHSQPRLLSLRWWENIESIVNLEDVTLSLFFWSYCNAVRYLLIANYNASGWRRTQIRKITFQNECYDMCLLCIMKTILQMFRILFVTKRRPDCHHHYFLQLLWCHALQLTDDWKLVCFTTLTHSYCRVSLRAWVNVLPEFSYFSQTVRTSLTKNLQLYVIWLKYFSHPQLSKWGLIQNIIFNTHSLLLRVLFT